MSKIVYPVFFNDIDINTVNGLTVLETDPYATPRRNLGIAEIIRTERNRLTGAFYEPRQINVRVELSRKTRALMEQSQDELMAILQPTEKPLVFTQSLSQRKYTATFSDAIPEKRSAGGSYLEQVLSFLCNDAFGYDLTATTLLSITSAYTSMSRSDRLTFGGSALWQTPVFRITFSAVAGSGERYVTIGNADIGQAVTITRTWANGDYIEIDSNNDTVKVNGVEVAHVGRPPRFNKGFGWWYYIDNFTSRSFTGNITCAFRYV